MLCDNANGTSIWVYFLKIYSKRQRRKDLQTHSQSGLWQSSLGCGVPFSVTRHPVVSESVAWLQASLLKMAIFSLGLPKVSKFLLGLPDPMEAPLSVDGCQNTVIWYLAILLTSLLLLCFFFFLFCCNLVYQSKCLRSCRFHRNNVSPFVFVLLCFLAAGIPAWLSLSLSFLLSLLG